MVFDVSQAGTRLGGFGYDIPVREKEHKKLYRWWLRPFASVKSMVRRLSLTIDLAE